MESHFRSAAEQFLDMLRIIDARQLDHDTVCALPLDHWLFRTGFIDPATHDLDGLLNDMRVDVIDGVFTQRYIHKTIATAINSHFLLKASRNFAGSLAILRRIAQLERQPVLFGGQIHITY